MNNQPNFEDWHHIIAVNEQTFISPTIKKAEQYLKNARNKEGDWGYYKDFPLDTHASSLAIEALRMSKSSEFETPAEDAAVRMKTITNKKFENLGVQQLVDSLNIFSGSMLRDSELESKLMARLKDIRHDTGWGDPEPSISLSCEVILSFMKLKKPPQEVIKQWVDYLSQYQRSDGGWGATPDSESAIIPTCQALRVFNRFSDKSMAKIRSVAIDFLRNFFQKKDWNELGDTFAISSVLRTLGEMEDFPFEIVQAGVDALYKRVNSDGGWGAAKEETSNVEYTALSIIALSLSGENKFVPYRLAIATLEAAESEMKQLRNERDKLLKDIESHVQKEINNIIQEREDLLKKVNSNKNEIQNLEAKVKELKSELKERERGIEREMLSRRYRVREIPNYQLVLKAIILVAIFNVGAFFLLRDNPYFFLSVVGIFTASFISYLLIRSRKQNQILMNYELEKHELEFRPARMSIVFELIDLLAEWPPSMREDFLFRFMKVGTVSSPEDADRYAHYISRLSRDYPLRGSQYERLKDIIYRLMNLPPSMRQDVIDDVQNRIFHER